MRQQPAYKRVATRVESMLASGELTPGDALPAEAVLAETFDVTRSTVRESLRLLEDAGYVRRTSPRKLVAALPTASSLAPRIERALVVNRVTLRDIWETNLALEPVMARLAAKRATEAQRAAILANVQQTEAALTAGEDLSALDEAFHVLLGEACNQPALQIAREPFSQLFQQVVEGLVEAADTSERLLTAHSRIAEAILRGDGEIAELWTRRHAMDFERGCRIAKVDIGVSISAEPRQGESCEA